MRRLWAAAALIALMAGLAGLHVAALSRLTGQVTGQLEQARQLLLQEDWDQARNYLEQARTLWEDSGFYLHTTLRHGDLDAVRACFHEALAYLELRQDAGECAAVCARLIHQLELILEAEQPGIRNLL